MLERILDLGKKLIMNLENKKKVWSIIQRKGDQLIGGLKPHPFHPKGRNPYAHICSCIKNKFSCSYKDIPDSKIKELSHFIENINE